MATSDHYDGSRFFNPGGANGQGFRNVPRMLKVARTPWPAHVAVESRRPVPPRDPEEIVVTFVGHSTFLVQAAGRAIITDPVFSERASPLSFMGPRRVRPPAVRFEDLPAISVVLLSHNHYDHCDTRTIRALARRFDPIFVTLLGNGSLLRSAGARQVEELDWWDTASASPVPIRATPAQHFSARHPFDRNRALWGGFVVELGARRLFFAGDSGYGPHFRDIGQRLGAIDVALVPIGAYEPRWFMKDIHMNPAEAVQAHLDVRAKTSIAMHFGTFQLTAEGIDEPIAALERARVAAGLDAAQFRVPEFGESLRF